MVALRYLALSDHAARHLAQMIGPAMEYRNATCFCPFVIGGHCSFVTLLAAEAAPAQPHLAKPADGKAAKERLAGEREGVCFSSLPQMMGAHPYLSERLTSSQQPVSTSQ